MLVLNIWVGGITGMYKYKEKDKPSWKRENPGKRSVDIFIF